jgi:hypothetical protein
VLITHHIIIIIAEMPISDKIGIVGGADEAEQRYSVKPQHLVDDLIGEHLTKDFVVDLTKEFEQAAAHTLEPADDNNGAVAQHEMEDGDHTQRTYPKWLLCLLTPLHQMVTSLGFIVFYAALSQDASHPYRWHPLLQEVPFAFWDPLWKHWVKPRRQCLP